MVFRRNLNHKYNAQKSVCQSGHTHPSNGEAHYCDVLRLKKKAGEIKDYEIQINHSLFVNGKKITVMRIDFKIINSDDSFEYHEYKGVFTKDFLIRKKLFEAINPNIIYKIITKEFL